MEALGAPRHPSPARRAAAALWERREHLPGQGFTIPWVRPRQPALYGTLQSEGSFSHQERCKQGGRAVTGSAEGKISFLAADQESQND